MTNRILTCAAVSATAMAMNASAANSDLYVTNASGDVYYVDGTTLQATELFTVQNTFAVNDIAYAGGNSLLYNSGHSIIDRNLQTGTESTVIDFADHFDGFFHSPGIALTDEGGIVGNIVQVSPEGVTTSMVTIDGNTHSPSAVEMDAYTGFFDHHALGNDLFLGATYTDREVLFTNAVTGVVEDRFDTDVEIVSFYESSQGIFAMTINGELHSVDLQSRSLDFYGQITGTNGSLIGATIPAPSSLVLLGASLITATRRRRTTLPAHTFSKLESK